MPLIMRALSIRQPWAELILRGIKRIEYRSRPTKIIGERFWIYASRQWAVGGRQADAIAAECRLPTGCRAWSGDLGLGEPEPWMIELANALRVFPHELPTGVIVGSAVIERVSRQSAVGGRQEESPNSEALLPTVYEWHLTDVERVMRLRKPSRHPQPVWFRPF